MYLFWLFSFTHSYFLLVLNFQQKQEVKVKLLSLSSQHHIYTSPSIGNLYLYCFLLIRFLLIKICSSFEKMSAQQKLCDMISNWEDWQITFLVFWTSGWSHTSKIQCLLGEIQGFGIRERETWRSVTGLRSRIQWF